MSFLYSAVDHFKKQFAYLEEHYGKGSTGTPPERQHASLPRYAFSKAVAICLICFPRYVDSVLSIFKHCWRGKFCACRACVQYSDNNSVQNSAEVADDLSRCCIKEVEKPQVDRSCGIPMTRLPIQVPQAIQGLHLSDNFAAT